LLGRTWTNKGLCLRESGFARAALEWLDRAIAVDPDNRRLRQERATTLEAADRVGEN
jgi:Tfp pilus assembly protein PilF